MSDMGDDFRSFKEHMRALKDKRCRELPAVLDKAGIPYEVHDSGYHLIIRRPNGIIADFWPSRQKWWIRNGRRSSGVHRLVEYLIELDPTVRLVSQTSATSGPAVPVEPAANSSNEPPPPASPPESSSQPEL